MRLGGLGQLWQTLRRLLSIMLVCQLLSPVVAFMAILLVGTESVVSSEASELITEPSKVVDVSPSSSPEPETDSCCVGAGPSLCPSDHQASPSEGECQVAGTSCSLLPLVCLSCTCHYHCQYGRPSTANCSVPDSVPCQGERNFTRQTSLCALQY